MEETQDRMPAPWPCPSCGGPLVFGAAYVDGETFVAVVCETEATTYRIA